MAHVHALEALEARAIREKQLSTFSAALGSGALFSFALLWLLLPPLWRVLNGEWSSSILPSLLALAGECSCCSSLSLSSCRLVWCHEPTLYPPLLGHGLWALSAVLALKCAQVQGGELLREFQARVPNATVYLRGGMDTWG